MTGAGTMLLSGTNNTYGGGTIVSAGTLAVTNSGALPSFPSGSVTVGSGAMVSVPMSGWAPSDIDSLRNNASFVAGAYLGLDTTNGNATYGGNISTVGSNGAGGLAIIGGNALCLTGSNSYAGPTLVSAGTLVLGAATAASPSSTFTINVNGGLVFGNGVTAGTLGGLAGSGNFALTSSDGQSVALTVGGNGQTASYTARSAAAARSSRSAAGCRVLAFLAFLSPFIPAPPPTPETPPSPPARSNSLTLCPAAPSLRSATSPR